MNVVEIWINSDGIVMFTKDSKLLFKIHKDVLLNIFGDVDRINNLSFDNVDYENLGSPCIMLGGFKQ